MFLSFVVFLIFKDTRCCETKTDKYLLNVFFVIFFKNLFVIYFIYILYRNKIVVVFTWWYRHKVVVVFTVNLGYSIIHTV